MGAQTTPSVPRRTFLKEWLAGGLGIVLGIFPFLAGLVMVLDPLRRRSDPARLVRLTTLDALPADGLPRKFSVVASRSDAWSRWPARAIGAVYLRRTSTGVQAFNVACPHAGCFVEFIPRENGYYCPCHKSTFTLDGRVQNPRSPSPRPLDTLDVEIRNGKEVWVKFQNFRAGHAEKVPA